MGNEIYKENYINVMTTNEKLRWASIVVAIIGIIDATYLSYVKIAHQEVYCGGSGACDTVNNSPYAEISGIPIAYMGLGAYIIILALLLLESRAEFWTNYSPMIVFGMTLAGTLYSIYLTYVELAVLHAVCPYCVLSAIAISVLFILSLMRLFTSQ
ncbi:MAG: hypothetical protein A2W33_05860 [Chloroflexi bacterium RBG_16_52_11]|nr:MAG: hypothetical protein A2W33_05860 [Chloroflexi bacterium RBG_16_52_11]